MTLSSIALKPIGAVLATLLVGGSAVTLLARSDSDTVETRTRREPTEQEARRGTRGSPAAARAKRGATSVRTAGPSPGRSPGDAPGAVAHAPADDLPRVAAPRSGTATVASAGKTARTKKHAAPAGPATAAEVADLRRRLADPKDRAASLREIRDRRMSDLGPEVKALLDAKEAPETRRLATQILALGDAQASRSDLEGLKKDKDPVVRINAAFGLARTGDEQAQSWLLRLSNASGPLAPKLAPLVESMLESPDLRSTAVLDRYRRLAADSRLDPAKREKAAAILATKLAPR